MASSFFSIEAGDSVVKVCLISKSKGKVGRITKAFMFKTPAGTVSDGVVTDPNLLAEKLKEMLVSNGVTSVKNVVFTLASGKVATREAAIPPVKESRIRDVLNANMNEYFPMDISKYQIDYGMIRQTDENGVKGLSVTLMAAPLTIIDSYVKFARAAGLVIDAIDYAGNSQFQMIKSLGNKKVSMYINVECQYSYVTITAGDALIFQRILPCGGNDYIEAYMSASTHNPGYMDALSACCVPMSTLLAQNIMTDDLIQDSLSRVVSGIARSMDFFNTLRYKDPLEEVILLGPCAHLAGLRETIAETTGFEQVYYLEESPCAASLGADAAIISRVVSAYGASIAPVQLLPEEFQAGKDKKKGKEGELDVDKQVSLLIPIIICVAVAAVGAYLAFTALENNRTLTLERDNMQRDIEATRYVEAVETSYIRYIADAKAYEIFENDVAKEMNNEGLVAFWEELERKMPEGLLMLTAVCTNEGITMSIRVPTLEAAAKVLVEFRTFESLGSVDASGISEDIDEAGMTFFLYTVNCRYYVEPEPEPEPEPIPEAPPEDVVG